MPHQPTTAAPRGLSATASCGPGVPSARGRQRQRLNAAAPVTHTMRARMTATHTAAPTVAYHAPVAPVARSAMDFSWKPTRMNASTFRTKTATSHTAYEGMRMRAGTSAGAPRRHHREDHHRDDAREVQPLGQYPDAERPAEL